MSKYNNLSYEELTILTESQSQLSTEDKKQLLQALVTRNTELVAQNCALIAQNRDLIAQYSHLIQTKNTL